MFLMYTSAADNKVSNTFHCGCGVYMAYTMLSRYDTLKSILNLQILVWSTLDHLFILSRNYLISLNTWCAYPYPVWGKLFLTLVSLYIKGTTNFTGAEKRRTTIEKRPMTEQLQYSSFFFPLLLKLCGHNNFPAQSNQYTFIQHTDNCK